MEYKYYYECPNQCDNEKIFLGNICDKCGFNPNFHLTIHLRIHRSDQLNYDKNLKFYYNCPTCDFGKKINLNESCNKCKFNLEKNPNKLVEIGRDVIPVQNRSGNVGSGQLCKHFVLVEMCPNCKEPDVIEHVKQCRKNGCKTCKIHIWNVVKKGDLEMLKKIYKFCLRKDTLLYELNYEYLQSCICEDANKFLNIVKWLTIERGGNISDFIGDLYFEITSWIKAKRSDIALWLIMWNNDVWTKRVDAGDSKNAIIGIKKNFEHYSSIDLAHLKQLENDEWWMFRFKESCKVGCIRYALEINFRNQEETFKKYKDMYDEVVFDILPYVYKNDKYINVKNLKELCDKLKIDLCVLQGYVSIDDANHQDNSPMLSYEHSSVDSTFPFGHYSENATCESDDTPPRVESDVEQLVATHAIFQKDLKNVHGSECYDNDDDKGLCKMCLSNDANCVFFPCKHMASCMPCANKISNCHICRTKINYRMDIFIS
jgi:hypothetical protein